jgi:hypothetical protein
MSTITVVAITVNAVTGVATTVGPMVTLIGTTLIPIIILIFILIIILILSTALVVGFGKGVTIVAAKAQFDRAGTSRHGFGAGGAARAASVLTIAWSASESPWAPGQCFSSRMAAARAFAASLGASKGEGMGLLSRAINACST